MYIYLKTGWHIAHIFISENYWNPTLKPKHNANNVCAVQNFYHTVWSDRQPPLRFNSLRTGSIRKCHSQHGSPGNVKLISNVAIFSTIKHNLTVFYNHVNEAYVSSQTVHQGCHLENSLMVNTQKPGVRSTKTSFATYGVYILLGGSQEIPSN